MLGDSTLSYGQSPASFDAPLKDSVIRATTKVVHLIFDLANYDTFLILSLPPKALSLVLEVYHMTFVSLFLGRAEYDVRCANESNSDHLHPFIVFDDLTPRTSELAETSVIRDIRQPYVAAAQSRLILQDIPK